MSTSKFKCIIAVGLNHTAIIISSEHPQMYEILGYEDKLSDDSYININENLVPGLYSCNLRIESWQDQTPDSCDWNMEVSVEDEVLINDCVLPQLKIDEEPSHEDILNDVIMLMNKPVETIATEI